MVATVTDHLGHHWLMLNTQTLAFREVCVLCGTMSDRPEAQIPCKPAPAPTKANPT